MPEWFDSAREQLRAHLNAITPLPEAEWTFFASLLEPAEFSRKAPLLRTGEPPRWVWFLVQGLVRLYYLTPDGKEFIKGFGRPGEIVAPLVAIQRGQDSGFSIEALESVRAVRFESRHLPGLFDRHPCWDRIGRILAEQAAARKETREEEFLMCDASERYRRFQDRYGDLVGRIPQRAVAAYIGITEVALSRLRNRS